jgi:hypothetical protein
MAAIDLSPVGERRVILGEEVAGVERPVARCAEVEVEGCGALTAAGADAAVDPV